MFCILNKVLEITTKITEHFWCLYKDVLNIFEYIKYKNKISKGQKSNPSNPHELNALINSFCKNSKNIIINILINDILPSNWSI